MPRNFQNSSARLRACSGPSKASFSWLNERMAGKEIRRRTDTNRDSFATGRTPAPLPTAAIPMPEARGRLFRCEPKSTYHRPGPSAGLLSHSIKILWRVARHFDLVTRSSETNSGELKTGHHKM